MLDHGHHMCVTPKLQKRDPQGDSPCLVVMLTAPKVVDTVQKQRHDSCLPITSKEKTMALLPRACALLSLWALQSQAQVSSCRNHHLQGSATSRGACTAWPLSSPLGPHIAMDQRRRKGFKGPQFSLQRLSGPVGRGEKGTEQEEAELLEKLTHPSAQVPKCTRPGLSLLVQQQLVLLDLGDLQDLGDLGGQGGWRPGPLNPAPQTSAAPPQPGGEGEEASASGVSVLGRL
ncbi:hypothetical protein QTO34_014970 [Cnephaeus nilssonii]|uniref:Uncharacterized protein n=1 Tax=Cnephaeus nilssonii TaxID=3371016 RepID=A0AA40H9Y0_CNENI|nr:hypothetical protein QTO34_014970 [Eptesicus nilssonii]